MLRREYDFADVLSLFHVTVGVGDLLERKYAIDVRMNPAFGNAAHDLPGPRADFFAFVPHVTEIQAEDAFVPIHQPDGIETGHLRDGFQSSNLAQDSRRRSHRHPEHSHASSSPQSAIAFLPACAAQRIDYQLNTTSIREIEQYRKPILIAVIDRMIQTTLFEKFML